MQAILVTGNDPTHDVTEWSIWSIERGHQPWTVALLVILKYLQPQPLALAFSTAFVGAVLPQPGYLENRYQMFV